MCNYGDCLFSFITIPWKLIQVIACINSLFFFLLSIPFANMLRIHGLVCGAVEAMWERVRKQGSISRLEGS